jgi:hypothetical protein
MREKLNLKNWEDSTSRTPVKGRGEVGSFFAFEDLIEGISFQEEVINLSFGKKLIHFLGGEDKRLIDLLNDKSFTLLRCNLIPVTTLPCT